MAIPDEFIQELKARTDIAEVISSYVQLKRSGRSMMGLCPFHSERSPSFSVNRENGYFHCFGCGAGGDVITFIRKIENMDYVEAVTLLAQRAGMTVPENTTDSGLGQLKVRICELNREAARFYHRQLYSEKGKEALSYLRGRGLTEKTIIHFGLGYSPSSRYELVNYLKEKGFSANEMVQANVAVKSQRGYIFDRFSDRVMFPIIDLRGQVIAFGGRIMSDVKPKYLNTSDTPVFNKSRNLFSLQLAKNKAGGRLILVEGYMDVIALHQAGFEGAVATLGTALTEEQAMLMKKYAEEVVVCYDADAAGQKATERALPLLRKAGVRVRVLRIPSGKDPDEFMRSYGEQGPARFGMLIERSGNDMDYRLSLLRSSFHLEIPEQRVEYLTRCAELLSRLENPVEQDVYLSRLAEETGVEKSAIRRLVQKESGARAKKEQRTSQRQVQLQAGGRTDRLNTEKAGRLRGANAEEALLALMLLEPDAAALIVQKLTPDGFVTSFNRRIYQVMHQRVLEGKEVSLMDLSSQLSPEEMSRLAQIADRRPRENDPLSAAGVYLGILEEERGRMTREQIASADEETLREEIERLRRKKQ